jgi:hypothetical protein
MNKHLQPLFVSVALFGGIASAGARQPEPASEFTTTDPKKVTIIEDSSLEKDPEMDSFQHLCPGLGGYEVIHEGGDLRSWINLRFKGRTTDLTGDTLSACRGMFPAKANHVVQWRGFRTAQGFAPYAVIYRMKSIADDAKQTRQENFIIIKLDGGDSRVVASVPAGDGNAAAEATADRLCQP